MSEDLIQRRNTVQDRTTQLLKGLPEDVVYMHQALLNNDPEEHLTELQQIERMEGYHDYVLICEREKIQSPTLDDFISFYERYPDALLSFGTGKHRVTLPHEEVEVDDTVSDEEFDESQEVHKAFNEGMPIPEDDKLNGESSNYHGEPEIVNQEPVVHEADLKNAGWSKSDNSDLVQSEPLQNEEENLASSPDKEESSIFEEQPGDSVEDVTETDETDDEERVPGRIDAKAVQEKSFTEKRGGYKMDPVDDFLDEITKILETDHPTEDYTKYIDKIKNTQFKLSKFTAGYDKAEVDGFLSAISAELLNRSTPSK